MALRAVLDTRLIKDSNTVQPSVISVALMGTAWFVPVLQSQAEQGSPSSRAKLQICRALTAVYAKLPAISTNTTAVVRMFPAALSADKAVRNSTLR